jgi:DNA modification methylase
MSSGDHFKQNLLCYGDNLVFLRNVNLFPDECVDLIYLDPPFNSKRPYNVLFKDVDGTPSAAQIKAFDDTWQWDQDAADKLLEIQAVAPAPLVELMKALHGFLGHSEMFAYLVQMGVRLVQLHRVLKRTGCLYLHCDSTANHYLRMVLDAIFGPKNFRNEIIWKRFFFHADAKRYGRVADTIHFYSKTASYTWHTVFGDHEEKYIRTHFKEDDKGRLYTLDNPVGAGQGPPRRFGDRILAPPKGTHWRWDQDTIAKMIKEGKIVFTSTGRPRVKRYLDEMRRPAVHCIWTDIPPINSQAAERLGYPTQKPVALLERIIRASSSPGDVILDPFCGCGTTIDAVETINREKDKDDKRPRPRRWIGVDVTHLAIHLIKHRLTRFSPLPRYEVLGEPADLAGARFLAQKDRFQFQFWALGLVGARAWGGVEKKGADTGIDGVRYFTDAPSGKAKTILVQVKSGHVKVGDVRDFRGVLERQNAAIGVFLTLEEPSKDMKTEAAGAGHYHSPGFHKNYPRLQILTIGELLGDPEPTSPRCLRIPAGSDLTFHKAVEYKEHNDSDGAGDLLEPSAEYETNSKSTSRTT